MRWRSLAAGLVWLAALLTLTGPAGAVSFSPADLEGTWSLQALGASEALGVKYTGIIHLDAQGNVLGGTVAPDWEVGDFTGGALAINSQGTVAGTMEGQTPAGAVQMIIKQGVMDLSKEQITLLAAGERCYNLYVVMVKVGPDETAYSNDDLNGIWEFSSFAYYDIHADHNWGQIVVSDGSVSGVGLQHTEPCTYRGELSLSDASAGAVRGNVSGSWMETRPGGEISEHEFNWQLTAAELNPGKDVIVGSGFNHNGYFSLMFLVRVQ
ncbi:MAG: hypothetical protein JRJ59_13330 [Deltaproteobacteria bacterium]|nr:hypothetical protein [Deltaproteobacteria bacterium]